MTPSTNAGVPGVVTPSGAREGTVRGNGAGETMPWVDAQPRVSVKSPSKTINGNRARGADVIMPAIGCVGRRQQVTDVLAEGVFANLLTRQGLSNRIFLTTLTVPEKMTSRSWNRHCF